MGNVQDAWRWMFASAGLPAAILFLALQWIPESPRWLVQKGRAEAALAALQHLNDPPDAERELERIRQSTSRQPDDGRFRDLIRTPLKRIVVVMSVLALLQQFTGVSPLLFYLPIVYEMAGFDSPTTAIWQTAVTACWSIACNLLAIACVDRWGRRPLLIFGCLLMAIGFIGLTLFFLHQARGLIILLPMFLCIGAYNLSLGPLVWLIMSEIFNNQIRSKAMALFATLIWLSNFVAVIALPTVVQIFERRFGTPAGVFAFFALICSVGALFIWRLLPETKDRCIDSELAMD